MAKQSFKHFTPRDKPKKRGARQHKKNKNKHEKKGDTHPTLIYFGNYRQYQ